MDLQQTHLKKIYQYILQFRDLRAAGMLAFLVIALLVTWSGVKVIGTNYQLQQQIANLQQQNKIQQLTNTNIQLENEYYNTNEYLDISARQNFGLAASGETVISVPQQVALAYTVNLANGGEAAPAATGKPPVYEQNFQAWMDFLLHRSAPAN